MNIRLTPLNIISSVLLVAGAYSIISHNSSKLHVLETVPILIIVLVCFSADLLFRTYLKTTKRVWIVELLFIIFAVLTIILIKQF